MYGCQWGRECAEDVSSLPALPPNVFPIPTPDSYLWGIFSPICIPTYLHGESEIHIDRILKIFQYFSIKTMTLVFRYFFLKFFLHLSFK